MNFGDAMARDCTVGRNITLRTPRASTASRMRTTCLGSVRAPRWAGGRRIPSHPARGSLLIADEIVQPHSTHQRHQGILGEVEQIGPGDEQCVQRCERAGGSSVKARTSVRVGLADMPPPL